jgi:hypothetical protein
VFVLKNDIKNICHFFVLFCFVLFCFVLFCFVLFYFVLFCFILFYFVLFCFVAKKISIHTLLLKTQQQRE